MAVQVVATTAPPLKRIAWNLSMPTSNLTATATLLLLSVVCIAPAFSAEPAEEDRPEWLRGRKLDATYSGGIALLYQHRCNRCHRPGEVAPMSFLKYGEIREWTTGDTNTPLESLIETRAMPPWPADPQVGRFSNAGFLTEPEMELLLEWIAAGLPRGEGGEPVQSDWVEGWNIGRPDKVFELPEQTIGEDDEWVVREFELKTDFPEDRWIVAAEARPGDGDAVVRIEAGPLGTYHPGNSFVVSADGHGRLLQAGATIQVRIAYRNHWGAESTDRSRLGVVFAKPAQLPLTQVHTARMSAPQTTIPAGAARVEVKTKHGFDGDSTIVSLMPIMNLRGKSVRYAAILPDGTRHELLSIPSWTPFYKFRYEFAEPLDAPAGTIVEAVATFDNSEENLMNPDPTVDIPLGPDSEELFEGWIGFTSKH